MGSVCHCRHLTPVSSQWYRPVAYWSHQTTDAERRYGALDGELFAVKYRPAREKLPSRRSITPP